MMARNTNNWGCDVTIAIVAIVPGSFPAEFVTVCDARISHGESISAADDATMKNRKVAPRWGMMFAAEDATAFIPVLSGVYASTKYTNHPNDPNPDEKEMRQWVEKAYEDEFAERFFKEHLSRFKYTDIADFRRNGLSEMGKDLYTQYIVALGKFDLGLELLVYGCNVNGSAHLFEALNPGTVISHNLRGFAAIGSGSLMALAALNRKPLAPGLSETIYRVLDAKFASETARDVGKKTYLITMNALGQFGIMPQTEVEALRVEWRRILEQPEPKAVRDIIKASNVISDISGRT